MAGPLMGDAGRYPTITVSMGISSAAAGFAVWSGSNWDSGLWGPDVSFQDVSQYVRSVSTTRGRSRELDRFNTGSMTIVLSNKDDRFTPSNLSGPYVAAGISQIRPGVVFKVEATWAGTTYPIFYGESDSWDDSYIGMGKDGITTVVCFDALAKLGAFDGLAQAAAGAGELAGARIARVAVNAAFDGTMTLDAGINTMQSTTLAQNALQDIGLTADSDGGYVWADASGALVFHDQFATLSKTRSINSQFTFGPGATEVNYEDVNVSYDAQLIFNVVSHARTGGTTYTTTDPSSRALYKKDMTYRRLDLICETDLQASTLADRFLARHKDAEYRIDDMTCQPANQPTVAWPLVLGALLRDRVTGKVTAPGATAINRQVFVDGISHTIDAHNGWKIKFSFSSATAYTGGLWDSAIWDTSVWYV